MKITDIMTKKLITVTPETDIHELAKLLVQNNISGAPVIDEDGKLLGIVREESVIFQDKKVHLPTFINLSLGFLTLGTQRYEEEIKKISASKVSEIMEKNIVTISPEMEIEDAATLMLEKEIYYLPVVKNNKLEGVLTKKDIVRAIAKSQ